MADPISALACSSPSQPASDPLLRSRIGRTYAGVLRPGQALGLRPDEDPDALPLPAAEPVTVMQLLSTRTTPSGQPIALPRRGVQLVVSRVVIAPGATLPVHMHPAQRYGYVLAGQLTVTLTGTGQVFDYKPGDFVVEVRDTWHSGTARGDEPVVLLVIDQVEAGQSNVVLREAQ